MDNLLGFKAGWTEAAAIWRPEQEQARAGTALQPTRPQGPHAQAVSKKSKFPKYGLQLASGNHIPSGGGTPGLLPPHSRHCDPRTQSRLAWSPSPCPGDHRKCQQSESEENSPPAKSEGVGHKQRGLPLGLSRPLTLEKSSLEEADREAQAGREQRQGGQRALLRVQQKRREEDRVPQVSSWGGPSPCSPTA